jgi:hypothetical protein
MTTVVHETVNCQVILDDYGFYARCTARDCTYESKYTPARYVARQWAEAHDEDQPDDSRES